MRSLHHITLDSGDSAMVPASHVQPQTLEVMRTMLRTLLTTGEAMIPMPGEWRVTAGSEPGRCLSAMIHARVRGDWAPCVWMGVANHSRCGAGLWKSMHDIGDGQLPKPKTDRATQPATPWLAARMMPGVSMLPDPDIRWMADFEECLAWAWILESENQ